MRWSRIAISVGVLGLALLSADWWTSAAGSSRVPRPQRAAAITSARGPLGRALRQYLAIAPRGPQVPAPAPRPPLIPRSLPRGTTCPVAAGGFCSLTPCVKFAGGASGLVPAVLLRAVVAVRKQGRAPATRALAPGGGSCRGRPAPPHALRVSGA